MRRERNSTRKRYFSSGENGDISQLQYAIALQKHESLAPVAAHGLQKRERRHGRRIRAQNARPERNAGHARM